MRVLFFVPGLPMGGAENHTINLCESFAERGHDVRLLVYGNKHAERVLARKGARNAVILNRPRGMSDPRAWMAVGKALREQDADVIFAVQQTAAIMSVFLRLAGRTRARIACIFHTTLLRAADEKRLFLFKAAARMLDALIFVSVNQQRYWQGRGLHSARSVAIVNGVDVGQHTSFAADNLQPKRALGFTPDDYVVGILATIRPEKNHVQLLEAATRLRREGLPVKVLFVGNGPTRPAVAERAEALGIAEHVVFSGEVDDVRPYIAALDVGVLCSTYVETFSVAALEQLATGVPMVMSEIGGAAEIVEDGVNGLLFEAGNTDELVERLRRLHHPETRRRFRAAARPSVERLSIERMVSSYERLALDLAAERAPARTAA